MTYRKPDNIMAPVHSDKTRWKLGLTSMNSVLRIVCLSDYVQRVIDISNTLGWVSARSGCIKTSIALQNEFRGSVPRQRRDESEAFEKINISNHKCGYLNL